jgi:hypothetical protein
MKPKHQQPKHQAPNIKLQRSFKSQTAILLIPLILSAFAFASCATTSQAPVRRVPAALVDNAATDTGENLIGLVGTVFQDYADVKENGVASLWSISKGLNAYHQVANTTSSITELIQDWKATKGDGGMLKRIAEVLNKSRAAPEVKALVVAKAAEQVALNKGP